MLCAAFVYFKKRDEADIAQSDSALWQMSGGGGAYWRQLALRGALLVALGFSLADIRTRIVSAPIIQKETRFVEVKGEVVAREGGAGREKIILKPSSIEGLSENDLPKKIRVLWRGEKSTVLPGEMISFRGVLNTPPGPTSPGDYDFGRQLYFEQIGGVGYAVSRPERIGLPQKGFTVWLENLRTQFAARIMAGAGDRVAAGAVCAAIVTGKRSYVSEETQESLRVAGLAHLLAISGLHMGLVAGILFFSIRLALASIERIALHYPIKKWAAAAALMGISFYLMISGGSWSARRAFIMAAIMFIAILFDRRALTLRNVALAALIILITTPEALLHVGFQLSFAAVTVLIAAIERVDRQKPSKYQRFQYGPLAPLWKYLGSLFSTSFLAGMATGPLALYHFNRMASWGLIANLAAMPFVGFLIMPFAVLGVVLIPTGLDQYAWHMMAMGFELVIKIAQWTEGLPAANIQAKGFSFSVFVALTFGGLWLCLNKAWWRWFGLAMLPIAYLASALKSVPDIYIADGGENMAFKMAAEDGPSIVLLNRRNSKFALGSWLESAGRFPDIRVAPVLSDRRKGATQFGVCDDQGCMAQLLTGQRIAVSKHPSGFGLDCQKADLLLLQYNVPAEKRRYCAAQIITKSEILASKGMSIKMVGTKMVIKRVSTQREKRPWG